jgi:hypothetical protein
MEQKQREICGVRSRNPVVRFAINDFLIFGA